MADGALRTYDIGFTPGSGNREDLLDQISIISPSNAPIMSTHPRSEANHVEHNWLTDTLAATSSAASVEGADFATASLGARSRLKNLTQIIRLAVKVSNTQRAVNPAGVADEYKYQIAKRGREVSRNFDIRFLSVSGSCATGSSAAARIMKSLDDFLTKAGKMARHIRSWGEDVTSGASATASATTITERRFNNVMQFLYHKGGSPDLVYTSSPGKQQINDFTGPSGARRNIELATRRLVHAVDLYDTEWGPMEIQKNRWCRRSPNTADDNTTLSGMTYWLERTLVRPAILRPIKHVPLPPVGDSTRGEVLGELTLEVLNPSGCARAWGVNNRGF